MEAPLPAKYFPLTEITLKFLREAVFSIASFSLLKASAGNFPLSTSDPIGSIEEEPLIFSTSFFCSSTSSAKRSALLHELHSQEKLISTDSIQISFRRSSKSAFVILVLQLQTNPSEL